MMETKKPGLWMSAALCGLLSASAAMGQPQDEPRRPEVRASEPAEVRVWNRPIVVLRAAIDGMEPRERAERIQERIDELPAEALAVTAEPGTLGNLEGMAIRVDGQMMFGLLPEDLDRESGESLEEVARAAASNLEVVLRTRAEAKRPEAVLRGLALTGAAGVFLVLFGWGMLRFRRIALRLGESRARQVRLLGVDAYPALSSLGRISIRVAYLGIAFFGVYLFVAFSLAQFHYTRPWGEELSRFLLDRLSGLGIGALHAIPGLFTVAVIFVLGRLSTRAASSFFEKIEKGEVELAWLEADTARATRRLLIVVIWIFVLTASYPYIPASRTDAFKGISVFLGLMVSLGGAGFVNQIMSGLVVVYARSFRIGDYVRVGDQEGIVSEIGALSTKIATRAREEITVPNAVLVGTTVTNYTKLAGKDGAMIKTSVTIGYDAPWRQVHALLELAALRTKGVRKTPPPKVLQRALADFYVEYQLFAHLERVEDRLLVLSDLHAQIQDAFNEFGVQIMSPHFESQPGEKVFVPRGQWSAAPAGEGTK